VGFKRCRLPTVMIIVFLGIYPEELKAYLYYKLHTNTIIIITNKNKHPTMDE
jgi:hypothetical protein